MSEVKKIATRDSYGNALAELGTEHDNVVVLDADLAAATKTGVFKKAHPDRFIDCGIAECIRAGKKLCWISTPECKDWCNTCRNLCRRRWSNTSVQ